MAGSTLVKVAGGAALAWLLLGSDDDSASPNKPKRTDDPPPPPEPPPGPPVQPPPNVDPVVILNAQTRDEPTIGFLYQVRSGDNATNIARRALGFSKDATPPGQGNRVVQYIRSMAASRWNWMYYATAPPAGLGPGYSYTWDGTKGTIAVIGVLPGNDNVAAAVAQRDLPVRRYQWGLNPNTGAPFSNGRTAHGPATYARFFMPPEGVGDPNAPTRNPVALLHVLGFTIGDIEP